MENELIRKLKRAIETKIAKVSKNSDCNNDCQLCKSCFDKGEVKKYPSKTVDYIKEYDKYILATTKKYGSVKNIPKEIKQEVKARVVDLGAEYVLANEYDNICFDCVEKGKEAVSEMVATWSDDEKRAMMNKAADASYKALFLDEMKVNNQEKKKNLDLSKLEKQAYERER